ncbi:MAG TPA: response regulator [Pirellulales bacterium]|jgi:putative two-component system response regulator|nr:response regulator [Pirellulales bacterium]
MKPNSLQILIVDDDEVSLEISRRTVERSGYCVQVARNGKEALEILREGRHRLVITDWVMPELDGIELCREIRAGDYNGYVYVILLTSRGETKDIVAGLSAGADDFMTKPFDPAELRVRVRTGGRIIGMETRDLAIFAMAKLAESRDTETGAHLERIRCYSRVLARYLSQQPKFSDEVDADYVRMIYLTSPLHDIGKVGIPDSVLLKPARLSEREFSLMKEHTVIGASTLDAALQQHPEAEFLRMGRDIALTHHERWDGSGYPQGLSGRNIPLCGRIVALADVYDALTSKRVYKDPFEHDVVRSIITAESGTHFDPDIVQAFLATEQEFIAIRRQFSAATEPAASKIAASSVAAAGLVVPNVPPLPSVQISENLVTAS